MNIEVYTRDGCPYCDQIKSVFAAKGWAYSERKLFRDFNREEFNNMFGQGSTFPRVLIDNKLIGGATETVSYLREQNLV
jgi:glutaredoxin